MPSYSLDLRRPGEDDIYVASHDFDGLMRPDDTFEYEQRTWRVVEVATKQFDVEGEPEQTLRCVPS